MFVASSPKNMEGVGPLPTLVAYTCGGGELLRDIPTRWLHNPVVGESLRNMATCQSHTPTVGKCLRDVPKHW